MTSTTPAFSDDDLAQHPTALREELLAGQVVVVSGGGSGIGRTTAWLAARLRAHVVICGRTRSKLDGVQSALHSRGYSCETTELDVRNRAAVDHFFAALFARHGGVHLLVNSAGGQFPQAALDFSAKGWRAVLDTNLDGTFNMMQSVGRHWHAAGAPGSIVNIVVSPRGLHGIAHSCAARGGVVAFSEAVSVEWAPWAIRVNCIAPGAVISEGWKVYPEAVSRSFRDSNPLRRACTPWDIAEACLFVGGPAGSFITGQTLHVNGGGNLWGEIWTGGKPEYFIEASRSWEAERNPEGTD